MLLVDRDIEIGLEHGDLVIDPFSDKQLNPHSYDLTLADTIGYYAIRGPEFLGHSTMEGPLVKELDCNLSCPTVNKVIDHEYGYLLKPGVLYLASTVERVGSVYYASRVDGLSRLGRLGLQVHSTSGYVDAGFFGTIPLQLSVVHPLRIYRGMHIAQLSFLELTAEPGR